MDLGSGVIIITCWAVYLTECIPGARVFIELCPCFATVICFEVFEIRPSLGVIHSKDVDNFWNYCLDQGFATCSGPSYDSLSVSVIGLVLNHESLPNKMTIIRSCIFQFLSFDLIFGKNRFPMLTCFALIYKYLSFK